MTDKLDKAREAIIRELIGSAHIRRAFAQFEQAVRDELSSPDTASAAGGGDTYKCKARIGSQGPNDPPDCEWPVCGCDLYADKVIEALEESGKLVAPVQPAPAAEGGEQPQPTQDDDSPVPAIDPDMGKVEEALRSLRNFALEYSREAGVDPRDAQRRMRYFAEGIDAALSQLRSPTDG